MADEEINYVKEAEKILIERDFPIERIRILPAVTSGGGRAGGG
ncbi:MAG: hypothetical protein U0841_26835 [Chloroflexia bacterium]